MAGTPLPPLPAERARAIVGRFAGCTVIVVGDVMLDRFLIGRVSRISPEAPVPVVVFDRDEFRLGGAANVAHNVQALGGAAALAGVTGDDEEARNLTAALTAAGLNASSLVTDPGRRTTMKMRIVTARHQQVARVDYESDHDAPPEVEEAIGAMAGARASAAGAIVVSDYLKGVVTRRSMAQIAAIAQAHHLPLLVDPKVPHMDFYRGATLVTPNQAEAESATHLRIRTAEDARRAARALRQRVESEGVLITLGDQGMWLLHGDVDGPLPAAARDVADVTGAGDTVIATLGLALAAGATVAEAAQLANAAAGVSVGKFGAATVSADELLGRF